MTISSATNTAGPFAGNGSTTAFPFAFKVFSRPELVFEVTDAAGTVSAKTLDSDFSVSLNADQDANPGGTITYPLSGAPLATGETAIISTDLPYTQLTDITNAGGFLPQVIEDALDRNVRLMQQQAERTARSVRAPLGESMANLPPAAERSGMLLTFDADGDPVAVAPAAQSATALQTLLAGTASGKGASMVGLPDVAAYWSSTNVEALSVEIGGILATMGARPERYADPGSGGDYTAALQSALNEGKGLYLQRGKIYGITAELTNTAHNVAITGGGTIKFLAGYDKSSGTLSAISNTGSYFVVDDVVFDGSAVTSASNFSRFVFGNGFRLIVTSKARFLNLPSTNLGITFQGALQCSGNAAYSVVNGAFFYNCPGAVFFQGRRCIASNNVIINPHDASIALNGVSCVGCSVTGNIVSNEDSAASIASMIAVEEGASEWVIAGNYISGIKDGRGIAAISIGYLTAVRGGKIIGNVINGCSYTTTNPCSLIEYNNYYTHVDVIGNTMFNLPTGNSNSRALIVAATGGRCAENNLDGANVTGQVLCEIRQGALGLTIENNTTRSGASGQHFWFQVGDYTGNPVHFKGGKTYGGTYAINAETNIASITALKLYIDDPEDNSTTNYVNAATQLGDRAAFLNAGAWARRPCHIGVFTNMYANAVLSSAGNQAIQNGDQFQHLAPTGTGGYIGYVRAAGAFKNYGVLA